MRLRVLRARPDRGLPPTAAGVCGPICAAATAAEPRSSGITQTPMVVTVRILGASEHAVLAHVAPDVYDEPVQPALAKQLLRDERK